MLHTGLLGGVGQRPANGHLIAPGKSIDEGSIGVDKEVGDEFLVFEGSFDDSDVVESGELAGNGVVSVTDVCADFIPNGGSDPADRGSLTASSVDGDKIFTWHVRCCWHPSPKLWRGDSYRKISFFLESKV